MHFAGASLLLLEEVIHSRLYINAEFGGWQLLSAEFVIFPFGALLLKAIITAEALGPYRVVVQDADLVLLATTVTAHHKRLLF